MMRYTTYSENPPTKPAAGTTNQLELMTTR
jgi:hypothetical protein